MEKTAGTSRLHSRLIQVRGCILLLTVFLAVFLFLFVQFRSAALQSITSANESFGNYVGSVLELSNANIRTSAMQVFYTSSIRTLRTSSDLSASKRIIGHRDLGNFVSSSNFIDNIMVYNGKLDVVFTSESGYGSTSSGQFHDQEAVYLLFHPEEHSYLTPFKRQANGSTHYSFIFSADSSSGFSSMLLDINADWYESQLLGALSEDRHMIVDGQGQPVILAEPAMDLPPWELFQEAFLSAPNSGYITPNDSLFLSSCWIYHKLGQTGWYYLEVFQLETDAPGLVSIQKVVFAVFALVCATILVLCAYILFVILPTFLHISRALTAVSSEEKKFTEKFDELLSTHQAYESNRKLQELQAGVFPPGTPLPVAFISSSGSDSGESLYGLLLLSCDVRDATLARSELGDILILPFCTSKRRNLLLASLQELELPSPIFVSLPCYSGEQLLEAFAALEELRQLAFLYPNQSILRQEILSDCNETSGLQRETIISMENSLKKGQLDVAQAQWLFLLNHIRRDRYKDFRFALHYVDRTLSALATEYGLEPAGPIDRCLTSLSALQSHIDGRLKAITDAVNAQQQQAAESLSRSVWDKIYALYHDENCCSQMIAEQLGMSPSYLNRQFRSAAGMSVGDAIQHVRIDKVCKLLCQSDLPVEQIARQVGYSNTKYFFVLFKKYIGKTPTQFRNDLSE